MVSNPDQSIIDFESVVENGADAIVLLDRSLLITFVNKSFEDTFGCRRRDFLGKPFPGTFKVTNEDCGCEILVSSDSESTSAHHGIFLENLVNGSEAGPFCISRATIGTGADELHMIVLKDMSPLAEYIEQIETFSKWVEDERSYLREILDGIADGYLIIDNAFNVKRISNKLLKLLGLTKSEVEGLHCSEVLRSGQCDRDCPLHWVAEHGKPIINAQEIITAKSGRKITIRKSTFPIRDHNQEIKEFICIIYDDSELQTLRHSLNTLHSGIPLVSNNKRMQEIFHLIFSMRDTDPTILVTGESGTGKELIAGAIVKNGPRAGKPYLRINCSALPEGLLESELFGHKKGAFTGAIADKQGKFSVAHGGTIMLDELGDMPLPLQAKLLRVLENGEFQAVGSTVTQKINVRIIAATNKDLQKLIVQNKFREDLFYRLCVVPIELPPLRERSEDIPHLIRYFVANFNEKYSKKINDVSARALAMLMDYRWPGNIRELRNAIEHAFACAQADILERVHFPVTIRRTVLPQNDDGSFREIVTNRRSRIDRELLLELLGRFHGNRQMTADFLNISRTTLWRKMKELKVISAD